MNGDAREQLPPADWPAGTSPAARADLAARSRSHGGVLATGRAQLHPVLADLRPGRAGRPEASVQSGGGEGGGGHGENGETQKGVK